MRLALFTLLLLNLLLSVSCAIARGAYCDQRRPDGTCARWAKHPYPCVNTPDGACTASTQ
jgi:hypothetical protein